MKTEEYLERRIKRLKKRDKDKKEFYKKKDSLSLVERNAYESILERNKPSTWFIMIPYNFLRLIFDIAVFMIVLCYMMGVDLELLRPAFFSTLSILRLAIPMIFIGLIIWISERVDYNKLKRELLGIHG